MRRSYWASRNRWRTKKTEKWFKETWSNSGLFFVSRFRPADFSASDFFECGLWTSIFFASKLHCVWPLYIELIYLGTFLTAASEFRFFLPRNFFTSDLWTSNLFASELFWLRPQDFGLRTYMIPSLSAWFFKSLISTFLVERLRIWMLMNSTNSEKAMEKYR